MRGDEMRRWMIVVILSSGSQRYLMRFNGPRPILTADPSKANNYPVWTFRVSQWEKQMHRNKASLERWLNKHDPQASVHIALHVVAKPGASQSGFPGTPNNTPPAWATTPTNPPRLSLRMEGPT